MNRISVLLLFGGESSEHDVSLASARNVYAALDDEKYEVLFGYIDRHGRWWLLEQLGSEISTHDAPQLVPMLGAHGFTTIPNNHAIRPDVILPILHGKNGEDGSVAALAQLLHIPCVGCDMTGGAVAMDKVMTKEIVAMHDIPVVPYLAHRRGAESLDYEAVKEKLGEVIFVKPARAGSSVGVSKVKNLQEFTTAIEEAHKHDDVALIERAVSAREIEVAVLGVPPHHRVTMPGEIIPDSEFYTYESKYSSNSTSQIAIPADLTDEQVQAIKRYALVAFETLGCSGLSRIDFFLTEDGTIYLNEVNTLPGFTNISMYPKLWRHEGISYGELIDQLIQLAL